MPNYTVLSARKASVHTHTHTHTHPHTQVLIRNVIEACINYIIPVCIIQVQYPFSKKEFLYNDQNLPQTRNTVNCAVLIIKAIDMHYFSNLFDKVFYMFRTGPLSIIRSISALYTSISSSYLLC
jgi:hypothetical protein